MKLGKTLRCKITGFEGICVAKLKHINGCVQLGLKGPMIKDGVYPDTTYLDIEQLEEVEKDEVKIKATPTGGSETRKIYAP